MRNWPTAAATAAAASTAINQRVGQKAPIIEWRKDWPKGCARYAKEEAVRCEGLGANKCSNKVGERRLCAARRGWGEKESDGNGHGQVGLVRHSSWLSSMRFV